MTTPQEETTGRDPQEEITQIVAEAEATPEAAILEGSEATGETPETATPPSDTSETPKDASPAEGVSDELTKLRTENTRLTQQAAQREAANQQQRIQQVAVAYSQDLTQRYIQQGIEETVAQQIAAAETRAQVAEYVAKQVTLRATALELSQEYQIPREQLDNFRDETAMRQFAQMYSQKAGPQAQQIAALEKKVEQLTKSRVPVQQYAKGGQPRGRSSYKDRLKQGGPMPSAEEIDRMTAKYLK